MRRLPGHFWSKVDRSGGPDACWLWTGCVERDGYGWGASREVPLAHRLAWILTHGPLPPGQCVCHSCDVRYPVEDHTYRRCCNPSHLWVGTSAENTADKTRKGRCPTGDQSPSRRHPERLARGDQHGLRLHPERAARGDRNASRKYPGIHAGTRNRNAKLTDDIVGKAQALAKTGAKTCDIARILESPYHPIWKAIHGVSWRHVQRGGDL